MTDWKFEHEEEQDSGQNGDTSRHVCAECRKRLDLGVDVLTLEPGVIGPRGVVPLGDVQLLCSGACFRAHTGGSPPVTLKRRALQIPCKAFSLGQTTNLRLHDSSSLLRGVRHCSLHLIDRVFEFLLAHVQHLDLLSRSRFTASTC